MDSLGYDVTDFMPSELTGSKAIDIHHIIGRGKCGRDRIENLMAVTREEHLKYGDKIKHMVMLLTKHRDFLITRNISFEDDWFNEKISMYED